MYLVMMHLMHDVLAAVAASVALDQDGALLLDPSTEEETVITVVNSNFHVPCDLIVARRKYLMGTMSWVLN